MSNDNGFQLIIDTREKYIIEELNKLNYTFTSKNLDIGDIVITKTENNITTTIKLIERKTVNDLKQSICDGRLKEQKLRILSNIDVKNVFYLIEGDMYSNSLKNMKKSMIGAITSMQLKDNLNVYKTKNIHESVEWIINLFEKTTKCIADIQLVKSESSEHTQNNTNYENKIFKVKKQNISKLLLYKNYLTSIPQVSSKIADTIISNYTSLKHLSENSSIEIISNLTYPIANNKQRRIGSSIATRIFQYLD